MSITKERTIKQTLAGIVIKWERDEDQRIEHLDEKMTLDADNNIDVQATYETLIKECGCTPEQAREQTAANIARVAAWKWDAWTYVYCTVEAIATTTDAETGETLDTKTAAFDSVGGIESFSGEEFQSETESECVSNLRYELLESGFNVTDSEWEALPRKQSKYSYEPTDRDPGEGVKPLPVLPEEDSGFTYRYGSAADAKGDYGIDDAEGEVLAVCKDCGVAMLDDADKDTEDPHYWSCSRFAADRDE